MILRHLPEAASATQPEPKEDSRKKLLAKGLPAQAISKIRVAVFFAVKKVWHFVLEAKDLRPTAQMGYQMKKIFGGRLPSFKKPALIQPLTTHEVKNEQYYLDLIKLQPRNLAHYDALGKFYLEQDNTDDARDIYQYLANHEPANPDFQARLAYCFYKTKNFKRAAEHYQKSLTLDSTQPNRYYNLGLSLEAAGKLPEAVVNFERAIYLEPSVKYYISLSTARLKLGDAKKAEEALLAAQRLDPENETLKAKLERFVKI